MYLFSIHVRVVYTQTMRDEIQTALQTTAETMVDEIIDKHNAAAQAMPAMEATEVRTGVCVIYACVYCVWY